MRLAILICLGIFLSLPTAALQASWQQDLDNLLTSDSAAEQERLLQRVISQSPDWQAVVERIRGLSFRPAAMDTFMLRKSTCIDGVERPWVLYLPPTYDPQTPTPLLVVLHGGVGSTDLAPEPVKYAREHEFATLAAEQGWLALFPFGQAGATWWDEVGMTNIRELVRRTKRECNVDDDLVWLGGFSDGASAAFGHAMLVPSDYAAFVALNGHLGVSSLDGDLPTYAPNLANRPIYAVTTDQDRLYPTAAMRPAIAMALAAGADILYRAHPGEHDFSYADVELPLIADFLTRNPRDPFASRIVWESAASHFGRCDWFIIDQVTVADAEPWHRDHNVGLIDSTIVIGFMDDSNFKGSGVRVDRVADGDYLARQIDLQAGDVIIRGNDRPITNIDSLNSFKTTLRRGAPVNLTVVRNEQQVVLSGKLPEPGNYLLFKRDKPSAFAKVTACGNRIEIIASRLGAFRVLVHPGMFKLDRNLVISVNGKQVHDAPLVPDLEFLLRNFLENRDRKLLYVAEVSVGLD